MATAPGQNSGPDFLRDEPMSATTQLFVTAVEFRGKLCTFWAQHDLEAGGELENLMNEIEGRDATPYAQAPGMGEYCWAKFEEDERWYRARVTNRSAKTPEKVEILLVDYGNKEVTDWNCLRTLSPADLKLPVQARQYVLADIQAASGDQWSEDEKENIREKLLYCEFAAHVLFDSSKVEGQPGITVRLCQLESSETPLVPSLLEAGVGKTYDNDHLSWHTVPKMSVEIGKQYSVYVPEFQSPAQFSVQLKDQCDDLECIEESLESVDITALVPCANLQMGQLCLALSVTYDRLYRALVIAIEGEDKCTVLYIDYSNHETIDMSQCYDMQPEFCTKAAMSVICTLGPDVSSVTGMGKVVDSETLECNVVKLIEDTVYQVELRDTASGETFSGKCPSTPQGSLTSAGLAARSWRRLRLDEGAIEDVCISSIENNNAIYAQLVKDAPVLDLLMSELQEAKTALVSCDQVHKEQACLVRDSDGVIYRGTVFGTAGNNVHVRCVDTGHCVSASMDLVFTPRASDFEVPCVAFPVRFLDSPGLKDIISLAAQKETPKAFIAKLIKYKKDVCVMLPLIPDKLAASDVNQNTRTTVNDREMPQRSAVATKKAEVDELPSQGLQKGAVVKLYITAVGSKTNEIFGQLPKYSADDLDQFATFISSFYDSQGSGIAGLADPKPGDLCATKFSEDDAWYRARVTDITAEGILMTFIDYGNQEVKEAKHLKQLVPQFRQMPAFGITCLVTNLKPDASSEMISSAVLDQEIEVKLVNQQGYAYMVTLSEKNSNPSVLSLVQQSSNTTVSPKDNCHEPGHLPQVSVKTGSHVNIIVTQLEPDGSFYCNLEDNQEQLDGLMEQIETYCQSLGDSQGRLDKCYLGALCLAQYSQDQAWYRAQVTGVMSNGKKVEVRFIDYGNSEVTTIDNIRNAEAQFLQMPGQGVSCILDGIPDNYMLSPDEEETLTKRLFESAVKGEFIAYDNSLQRHRVIVRDGQGLVNIAQGQSNSQKPPQSNSVSDNIVNTKKACAKSYPSEKYAPGDNVNAAVVYVVDPDEFYCQPAGTKDKIETLLDDLNGYYENISSIDNMNLRDPQVSQACVVRYAQDGHFYRCQVKEISGDQATVVSVDHGHTETVSIAGIYMLHKQFADMPSQAFCCSLSNVKPQTGQWTDEAADAFEELILEQEFIINIKQSSTAGTYQVQLIDPGNKLDVVSELVQKGHARHPTTGVASPMANPAKTKPAARPVVYRDPDVKIGAYLDVFVTYVLDPSSFYCQQKKNATDLDLLMEQLTEYENLALPLPSLTPGQPCVARFPDDNQWYRAKVLSVQDKDTVLVLYVDYGNEATVDRSQVKYLQPEYAKLPIQGLKCGLADVLPNGDSWTDDVAIQFEQMVWEKDMVACITSTNANSVHLVELVDSSTPNHPIVNELMVKQGLARSTTSAVEAATSRRTSLRKSASSASVRSGGSSVSSQDQQPLSAVISGKYKKFSIEAGKTVDVTVVHIDSPENFYVQLTDNCSQLDEVMAQLNTEYNGIQPAEFKMTSIQDGSACVAQFSVDDSWYRAEVVKADRNKVKVHYIDYGNSEVISPDRLKMLKAKFFVLPEQAIKCQLDITEVLSDVTWPQEIVDYFEELAADKILKATVLHSNRGRHVVQLMDSTDGVNANVGAILSCKLSSVIATSKTSKQKAPSPDLKPKPVTTVSFKDMELPKGQTGLVIVTWAQSCQEFWCQWEEGCTNAQTLQEQMFETYQKLKLNEFSLSEPTIGHACVAQFAQDGNWYRAKIVMVKGNQAKVLFVDYGNTAIVPFSKVKQLQPDFGKLPVLAFKCHFADLEVSKLPAKAVQEFASLASSPCTCTIEGRSDGIYSVSLVTQDGMDIASALSGKPGKKKGVGQAVQGVSQALPNGVSGDSWDTDSEPVSLPRNKPVSVDKTTLPPAKLPAGPVKVVVSHVKNLQQFWCQPVDKISDLETMMGDFEEKYVAAGNGHGSLGPVKSGMVCAAKFSEDGFWYRAKVLNCKGDRAEVLFVDYGNSEEQMQSQLKKLLPDFTQLPPFAVECCFGEPLQNTDTVLEKFHELVDDKELVAKFKHGPSEKHEVQLEATDGSSINRQLLSIMKGPSDNMKADKTVTQAEHKVRSHELQEQVYVAHAESLSQFYLQLVSWQNDLDTISQELQDFASNSSPNSQILQVLHKGDICGALFSEDETWYRAKLLENKGSSALVHFIDYGNNEEVSLEALRELPPKLLQPAPCAVQCCLQGVSDGDGKLDQFLDLVIDKELTAKFINKETPAQVCLLSEDGQSINQAMGAERDIPKNIESLPSKPSFSTDTTSSEKPSDVTLTLPAPTLPDGTVELYTSHITSPSEFFLQLSSMEDQLADLSDSITVEYSALGPKDLSTENLSVGQVCCAKYSEDDAWYRAVVTKISGDMVHVRFVDFGNTSSVQMSSIKVLQKKYTECGPYAIFCTLRGFLVDRVWNSDEIGQFEALVDGVTLTAEFHSSQEPFEVTLLNESGQNIFEVFNQGSSAVSEEEVTEPLPAESVDVATSQESQTVITESQNKNLIGPHLAEQVPPGLGTSAFISHIDNPASFYLQLASQEENLEELSNTLVDEYSSLDICDCRVEQPCVGLVCCSQYSVDSAWYRAIITDVTGDHVCVRFLDFGNTDTVDLDSIRVLKETCQSAPYAYNCQLRGLPSNHEWTNDQITKFTEMNEETLTVDFLTDSPPYEVTWKKGGVDISEHLCKELGIDLSGPVLEAGRAVEDHVSEPEPSSSDAVTIHKQVKPSGPQEGFTSHAISPASFFVQLSAEENKLTDMSDALADTYSSLDVTELRLDELKEGQICCSQFTEDHAWYRAVITGVSGDQVSVQFLDFGNSDTVDCESVRILKDSFLTSPPFAYHCQLEGFSSDRRWTENECEQFSEMVTDVTYEVTFLSDEPPFKVTMVADGSLNDELELKFGNDENISSKAPASSLPSPDNIEATLGTDDTQEATKEIPETMADLSVEPEATSTTDEEQEEFEDAVEEQVLSKEDADEQEATQNIGEDEKAPQKTDEEKKATQETVEEQEATQETGEEETTQETGEEETTQETGEEETTQETGKEETTQSGKLEKTSSSDESKRVPFTSLNVGDKVEMYVSYVKDLSEFWCQPASSEAVLDEITAALTSHEMPTVEDVQPGDTVLVRSDEENVYRGIVESAGENLEVYSLDYGSTDQVARCDVAVLCDEHRSWEAQAIQCCLHGLTGTVEESSEETINCFSETVLEKKLLVHVCDVSKTDSTWRGDSYTVKLLDMGIPVTYEMVKKKMKQDADEDEEVAPASAASEDVAVIEPDESSIKAAAAEAEEDGQEMPRDQEDDEVLQNIEPISDGNVEDETQEAESSKSHPTLRYQCPDIEVGQKLQVFISANRGPHDFWCQTEESELHCPELVDLCHDYCDNLDSTEGLLSEPSVGTPCVAKYSDDNWYRAVITGVELPNIHICYIDYGNVDTIDVSAVKAASGDLMKSPAQAFHCALANIQPLTSDWDEEACARFTELCSSEGDKVMLEVTATNQRAASGILDAVVNVTLGNEDSDIRETLIDSGYAKAVGVDSADLHQATPVMMRKDLAIKPAADTPVMDYADLELPSDSKDAVVKSGEEEFNDEVCSLVSNVIANAVAEVSRETQDTPPVIITEDATCETGTSEISRLAVVFIDGTSPSDFICHSTDSAEEMLSLMADMAWIITQDKKNALIPESVQDGDVMAARFRPDQTWYRVHVEGSQDDDQYKVAALDYSHEGVVSRQDLRALSEQYTRVPGRAIRCCLADLEDTEWTEEACKYFKFLCEGREELTLETIQANTDKKQEVYLYDPADPMKESINMLMLYAGHAAVVPGSRLEKLRGTELEDQVENEVSFVELEYENSLGSSHEDSEEEVGKNTGEENTQDWKDSKDSSDSTPKPQESGDNGEGLGKPQVSGDSEEGLSKPQELVDSEEGLGKPQESGDSEEGLSKPQESGDSEEGLSKPQESGDSEEGLGKPQESGDSSELTCKPGESGDSGHSKEVEQSGVTRPVADKYITLSLEADSSVDVHVLTATDPDNLVIQLMSYTSQLSQLMGKLHQSCEDGATEKLQNPEPGQVCCCRSPDDNTWYRSQVTQVMEDQVQVYCADNGHVLTTSRDELYALPQEHLDFPAQALRCSMADIKPSADVWDQDVNKELEALLLMGEGTESPVNMTIRSVDEDGRITAVFSNSDSVDIGKALVDKGLAAPTQQPDREELSEDSTSDAGEQICLQASDWGSLPLTRRLTEGSTVNIRLTHVVSPDELYCQVESETLHQLTSDMQEMCDSIAEPTDHDWSEGDSCCILAEDDGCWHRAQVVSNCDSIINVMHVDHGNLEVMQASRLRPLHDKFTSEPPFAIKCKMMGVTPFHSEWDEKPIEFLLEKMDTPLVMKVVTVESNGVHQVELIERQSGATLQGQLIDKKLAKATDGDNK